MVRHDGWSGVVSRASGFVGCGSCASCVVGRGSCAGGILECGSETSVAARTSGLDAGGEVVEGTDAVGVAVGIVLMEQAVLVVCLLG